MSWASFTSCPSARGLYGLTPTAISRRYDASSAGWRVTIACGARSLFRRTDDGEAARYEYARQTGVEATDISVEKYIAAQRDGGLLP